MDYIEQLDRWEGELRVQMEGGDLLLGELAYGREALEKLGALMTRCFASYAQNRIGLTQTLRKIRHTWPLSYALYLVLEGIYNYESGNYWSTASRRFGLKSQVDTAACGKLFRTILRDEDLRVFEEITSGHQYVTRILLHGGIPAHSLDAFFNFLKRQVADSSVSTNLYVAADTLLAEWQQDPSYYLDGVAKPVRRFLRYGGAVAEDFLTRALELFECEDDAAIDQIDLPERVLTGFKTWRAREKTQIVRGLTVRLNRPLLYVAPYAEGVMIDLPPQEFPQRIAPSELAWTIGTEEQPEPTLVATDRQRTAKGYEYRVPDSLPIAPAPAYFVTLLGDGVPLRSWTLDGVAGSPLLIFEPFDDYSADQLNAYERQRPGERWLMFPRDLRLHVDEGDSRLQATLPRVAGPWSNFTLEHWSLASGTLRLVNDAGITVDSHTIIAEAARRRPYLVGDRLDDAGHHAFPLFAPRPPSLAIQLNDRLDLEAQLHRWRVTILPEAGSTPVEIRSYRLDEVPETVTRADDNTIHVNLAATVWLGEDAVGKFAVRARGPLGRGNVLGCRIWPGLQLSGHERVYYGDSCGPARLTVTCAAGTTVLSLASAEHVSIDSVPHADGRARYLLEAQPGIWQMPLRLETETGTRLPITLPLRRVRWGTVDRAAGERPMWQDTPVQLIPAELQPARELRLDLPLFAPGPRLGAVWQVLDPCGDVLLERESDGMAQELAMPLTELRALWREAQTALQVRALIIDLDTRETRADIELLRLGLTFDLGETVSEWVPTEAHVALVLLWERPQHARHRVLHLWPAEHPLVAEPLTVAIPDSAAQAFEVTLSPAPTWPGSYIGYVDVQTPWSNVVPERPAIDAAHAIVFEPPAIAAHYAAIAEQARVGRAPVADLLSLLLYQYRVGSRDEMYDTNRHLSQQRNALRLEQLLLWADSIEHIDPTVYQLARFALSHADTLARICSRGLSADMRRQLMRHLLPTIPSATSHRLLLEHALTPDPIESIRTLCRKGNAEEHRFGIEQLVARVADASIMLEEAVELLQDKARVAAEHLATIGSSDAFDILERLEALAGLKPYWVRPGTHLVSDLGRFRVISLRDKESNCSLSCTTLGTRTYAAVKHWASPPVLDGRLDLSNGLLRIDSGDLFVCYKCRRVYSEFAHLKRHYALQHPNQAPYPKKLKKELKIKNLRICAA